jgi:hypothetical protein
MTDNIPNFVVYLLELILGSSLILRSIISLLCLGSQVFKEDLCREVGEVSPNMSEVSVSLCYNGNISRLTVTLFEARGIKVCILEFDFDKKYPL